MAGFERPDGDRLWPNTHNGFKAKQVCATCPFTRQCADEALTAGSGLNSYGTQPADDVICAGYTCRGDRSTERALRKIAAGGTIRTNQPRPADCVQCEQSMRGPKDPADGRPRHHGRGICDRCHATNRRTETTQETAA